MVLLRLGRNTWSIWLLLLCLLVRPEARSQEQSLKIGSEAPDFALPYATKDSIPMDKINLSSFRGKRNVILAFYPADWSKGCTREVCKFRDSFSELETLDAEILAVSGDYVYSHHEWAKSLNLGFKLLSDHDHVVARVYGSFNEDSGYNKRTVFVVNKDGILTYEDLIYNVRADSSFVRLRQALQQLK